MSSFLLYNTPTSFIKVENITINNITTECHKVLFTGIAKLGFPKQSHREYFPDQGTVSILDSLIIWVALFSPLLTLFIRLASNTLQKFCTGCKVKCVDTQSTRRKINECSVKRGVGKIIVPPVNGKSIIYQKNTEVVVLRYHTTKQIVAVVFTVGMVVFHLLWYQSHVWFLLPCFNTLNHLTLCPVLYVLFLPSLYKT